MKIYAYVFLQEFIVFALTFWSLIHLELIFVSNLSYRGPDLFFCMCTESCPYNTCWKDSFFSLIFLVLWLKIQFTVKVFMFCTSICLFWMTVLQSLDYCNFEVSFKIGKYDIPMFFSFFRNILGILSRFHFYMNFRIGSTCQFLQIILLRF